MASLVLGTVGAVAGGIIGGPMGAEIGWMIGSAIGSLFDPKQHQDGPRLADLRVQSSTYGKHIPRVWGTFRLAGNLIWSQNLQEKKNSNSMGKGMGGGVVSDTYSYTVTCAVSFCHGPVNAFRKIWANGTLVYDVSDGNTGFVGDIKYNMRFYYGTEDQQVDPAIEAIMGVGQSPAYRGQAYIVFDTLDLSKYNNQIPNFEVEVVNSPDSTTNPLFDYMYYDIGTNPAPYQQTTGAIYNPVNNFVYIMRTTGSSGGFYIDKIDPLTKTRLLSSPAFTWNPHTNNVYDVPCTISQSGDLLFTASDTVSNNDKFYLVNADTLQATSLLNDSSISSVFNETTLRLNVKNVSPNNGATIFNVNYVNDGPSNNQKYGVYSFNYQGQPVQKTVFYINDTVLNCSLIGNGGYDLDTQTGNAYFLYNTDVYTYWLSSVNIYTGQCTQKLLQLPNAAHAQLVFTDLYFDSVSRSVFVQYYTGNSGTSNSTVAKINVDNLTVQTVVFDGQGGYPRKSFNVDTNHRRFITNVSLPANQYYAFAYLDWDLMTVEVLPYSISANDGVYAGLSESYCAYVKNLDCEFWIAQTNSNTINTLIAGYQLQITNEQVKPTPDTAQIAIWQANINRLTAVLNANTSQFLFTNYGYRVTDGSYPLNQMVQDISVNAGLTTSQLDTSSLTGLNVRGYASSNRVDARSLLQQINTIFSFDMIESQAKVVAKLRGSLPIVTIPYGDLGAQNYSDTLDFSQALSIQRQQDMELPKSANIVYLDLNKDKQQNTQQRVRVLKTSQNAVTYEIPIVLTADEAKQVVDKLVFYQWGARDKYTFSTTTKYAYLEPTDVIQVIGKDGTVYTMRLTKRDEDGNIIKWEAESEKTAVYTQQSNGVTGSVVGQTIQGFTQTRTKFLDIPIFTENDNDGGFYYVSGPANPSMTWQGSQLFMSQTSDSNTSAIYNSISTNYVATLFGSATSQLQNWTGGNVVDCSSFVTVYSPQALSSIDYTTLLNGGNLCMIGGEVCQFMNATLTGTNTYLLTGFLRGRYGTEQVQASHSIGEDFFILNLYNGSIHRIHRDTLNINNTYYYKNVTLGTKLTDASEIPFTNSAIGLKPYAVSNVRVGRDSSGTIYFNFNKRTRGLGLLKDNFDIVDLDGDSYQVDILKSGVPVRTITISGATSGSYTTQNQIADFGANQSAVTAVFYKINSIVGRGYPLTVTL